MSEAPAGAGAGGGGSGLFGFVGDIAQAGIGAYGSLYGGKAQKQMYDYQAGVARAEAAIASNMAKQDIMAGEVRAQQAGLVGRANMARTAVRAAAGNVDIHGGSTGQVLTSELAIAKQNQADVRYNASRLAFGEEVKAAGLTAQAGLFETAGHTAMTAAWIGAASSIVGGAGNVADKWMQVSSLQGGSQSGGEPYWSDIPQTEAPGGGSSDTYIG